MLSKNKIKELLSRMTEKSNFNLKIIKNAFGSLEYRDEDNQTLLHIFVDEKYDEEMCFLAIKSLLQIGLSPNLEDDFNYNFIQTALYTGYSEEFILRIIKEALKYNLNINHVDSDKDTIMHTVIYSDDYLGEIENIYKLLCSNGYDSTKICSEGRNLLEAMRYQKQYTSAQIERFEHLFNENTNNKFVNKENECTTIVKSVPRKPEIIQTIIPTLSEKELLELEKYGKVLTSKNYIVQPTIGRENELKCLIVSLAQDELNPLIVGVSGIGKTALVKELAYRIKTGQVPKFLQGRIILDVNPSQVVAGREYVGQFEQNMINLMKLCEKYNVILFIDEIHRIYGIGSAKGKDNDMSSILKHYIDRSDLDVIGATTEIGYNEYFSNDDFKRRFEKISLKEPSQDVLSQIINKVIEDQFIKNAILFENQNIKDEIVKIILEATEKRHRIYHDIVNNPALAISIINKAYGYAKAFDSEFITPQHFIESFKDCARIYDTAKEKAIIRLKKLENNVGQAAQQKVLTLNFNRNGE